jgi:uncharacterized protein
MPLKTLLLSLFFAVFGVSGKNLETKPTGEKQRLKISIVIDDLGDNSVIARQMLSVSEQMTAAILPHTPHAKLIAEFATANGHEVIMHLPMEALSRPDLLGPGALLASMGKPDLQKTVMSSASSVPFMVGFNNHMGSLLTQDEEKMTWVMESAKQMGWYFLDSKTSESSVAQDIAGQLGIPAIGRDIFLDHHNGQEQLNLTNLISQRFEQAKKIARLRGHVVIICHPYPETLMFLQQHLPTLDSEYQMVSLSHLLPKRRTVEDYTYLSR